MEETQPLRLDAYLQYHEPQISRSKLQQHIKSGAVQVNNCVTTKPSTMVTSTDVITYTLQPQQEHTSTIEAVALPLEVLYESDNCIVFNKPAGISVHPGHSSTPNEVTFLHGIKAYFEQHSLPFYQSHTLVHRLDKDTTGCILVAKNPEQHAALQAQFAARTVQKKYCTLCNGLLKNTTALISAPIGRSTTDRTKMNVSNHVSARTAQTRYQVVHQNETIGVSLVDIELLTGRTHQIRVHFQSINHPLLGDASYTNKETKLVNQTNHIEQICLHAYSLEFTDGNTTATVTAPLPDYFKQAAKKLHINYSPLGV